MDSADGKEKLPDVKKPLLRTPARASIWYTAASFAAKGIGFALTPIFTRILSDTEFGIYPLYCGWFSVLYVIMTAEIGSAVLYRGFAKFKNRSGDFTKSALSALLSVFLPISFVFFLFIDKISAFSGLPVFLLTTITAHTLSDGIISLLSTRERYFYGYKRVFLANVIPSVLSPVFALILISFIPSYARPVGAATASILCASALIFALKGLGGRFDKDMAKYVLICAALSLPSVLASVLLTNADKLMIGRVFGSAALAKYSIAHSLGLVLTFLTVGLFGALKPWITRKLAENDSGSVLATVRLLFLFFTLLTAALLTIAPEFSAFLAPSSYGGALWQAYILALAVLPMFLSNVLSSVFLYKERAWITSLLTISAALFNISLNALFFTRFSYGAAALSFLISYSLLVFFEWLCLGKKRPGIASFSASFSALVLLARILYLLRGNILLRLSGLALILPSLIFTLYKILLLAKEK